MNQPNNTAPRYMTAPKVCHNPYCQFESHERIYKCPKCGRPMWTPNEFRLISSLLIPCGLVLAVIGAGLIYLVAVKVSGGTVPEYRDSAVPSAVLLFLYGLFGIIFAAGIATMTAGVWQVLTARASRWLINFMVGLFIALFAIAIAGKSILALLGFGGD